MPYVLYSHITPSPNFRGEICIIPPSLMFTWSLYPFCTTCLATSRDGITCCRKIIHEDEDGRVKKWRTVVTWTAVQWFTSRASITRKEKNDNLSSRKMLESLSGAPRDVTVQRVAIRWKLTTDRLCQRLASYARSSPLNTIECSSYNTDGCSVVRQFAYTTTAFCHSRLLSRLFSSLLTPHLALLRALLYSTLLRVSLPQPLRRSDTNQTPPPAPSSCPTRSHHQRHPPSAGNASFCQIQSHLLILRNLIFVWPSCFSLSFLAFSSSTASSMSLQTHV